MNAYPSDLIPELLEWNHGAGITLADFAHAIGRYDHALAYAQLFWPSFVEYDGCILLKPVEPDNYKQWMATFADDRTKVEEMLNHVHIADILSSQEYEPTAALISHLAQVLKEMWSCKLRRDFPTRQFQVRVSEGTADNLLAYELTLFQEHRQ